MRNQITSEINQKELYMKLKSFKYILEMQKKLITVSFSFKYIILCNKYLKYALFY